jgi:YidC/Oxa1 family membrane protein insertase
MFTAIFYTPFYNALVYIIGHIPHGDVGLAVIVLTVLINIALAPLKLGASRTQKVMRDIQGEQDAIKKKFTDPKEQMKAMSELYKKHGVNPLASFLAVLIQLPIIIGLYQVFVYGFPIDPAYLYSWVSNPETVTTTFLGFADLTQKSLSLAVLAGISQFALAFLMPAPAESSEASFANDFAKSMYFQSKYFLPVFMAFIAYSISSVVALYLIVSNIASACVEVYPKVKQLLAR